MKSSTDAHQNRNLDEQLAAYVAIEYSPLRTLLVNLISEIERLELIIAQQCQSLEAVEQSLTDIELETLETIFNETTTGIKKKIVARFTNDHQRRYEQRSRLRRNSSYAALQESRRGMAREKARLTARLHKLEAYRAILLVGIGE
jgi:hypothetical protein